MPYLAQKSTKQLATCERDLQTLCNTMIRYIDFCVVYGHRTKEVQFQLYREGREFKDNRWIISEEKKVVTYMDGTEKKSMHNYFPSKAVDIYPYPWPKSLPDQQIAMAHLVGFAKALACQLKIQGVISSEFEFGYDWKNPYDPPHIQIKQAA